MLELKYNSYEELPIEKYLELKEILQNDDDDSNKQLEIIALLADISIEELLEQNISEIQGIANKCDFLSNKQINIKEKIKTITVNNIEYTVCTDLQKFTVAQYVDFQNYPKDEKHLADNLSTFVIPKGKKYGEDYDVVQVIQDFNKYLDISTAISLQNFFIKKLLQSTKATLRYLLPLMKMEMKKTKNPKAKEVIKQIQEIQRSYGLQ